MTKYKRGDTIRVVVEGEAVSGSDAPGVRVRLPLHRGFPPFLLIPDEAHPEVEVLESGGVA